MQDPVTPVLFGAFALLFVPLFLAVLSTDEAARATLARHGGSPGAVGVAVVAVTCLVVGLFWLGSVPADRSFAFPVVGLYLSAVGLAFAAGNARRLVGLLRAERTATGDTGSGRVAVTGTVRASEPPQSPVFERPAVAWSWSVAVKNRHGTDYEGRRAWSTERTGSDGVPFVLDDGSGPIRVDPADARLSLAAERTETRDPDEVPGRLDSLADLEMGGERFRYTERVLEPGRTATVVGEVDEETGFAADTGSLVVVSGTGREIRWRLALRTLGIGVASLAGFVLTIRTVASTVGLTLTLAA